MREMLNNISHTELYNELFKEGATRGQVVLNWREGNQTFKVVSEGKTKLKLSNE